MATKPQCEEFGADSFQKSLSFQPQQIKSKENVQQLIAAYNSPKELRRAKSGHNNGAEAASDRCV
jgi:hypothetical protein